MNSKRQIGFNNSNRDFEFKMMVQTNAICPHCNKILSFKHKLYDPQTNRPHEEYCTDWVGNKSVKDVKMFCCKTTGCKEKPHKTNGIFTDTLFESTYVFISTNHDLEFILTVFFKVFQSRPTGLCMHGGCIYRVCIKTTSAAQHTSRTAPACLCAIFLPYVQVPHGTDTNHGKTW